MPTSGEEEHHSRAFWVRSEEERVSGCIQLLLLFFSFLFFRVRVYTLMDIFTFLHLYGIEEEC
jgi:hypothetical protein